MGKASFLNPYVRAHNRLRDERRLSVPPDMGTMAIFYAVGGSSYSLLRPETEKAAFAEEAERVAEESKDKYARVRVMQVSDRFRVFNALQDPQVAGLTLIGHGTISAFYTGNKPPRWSDVATEVQKEDGHLKMGKIVQRFCGGVDQRDSITWGTFAVYDQRNVLAPIGQGIEDLDPDEDAFRPVYSHEVNTPRQILAAHEPYKKSNKPSSQ